MTFSKCVRSLNWARDDSMCYRETMRFFWQPDRKSTRLNSSHLVISYAVFCLKKKKQPSRYGSRAYHIEKQQRCHTPRCPLSATRSASGPTTRRYSRLEDHSDLYVLIHELHA